MPTAIARQLLSAANLSVPLLDSELAHLAATVGLRIARPIPLPRGVGGILARSTYHPRADVSPEGHRCAFIYAIARRHLFGPEDSCLCFLGCPDGVDEETPDWQRLRRAALLAGALMLGADYEPAKTPAEIAEVAEMARVPANAIEAYQGITAQLETERDAWRFPALGRRLREQAEEPAGA